MHRRASDGRRVLVAVSGDAVVVGYIHLEAHGHIDHLYCAPEAVSHGVAARLYNAVEDLAKRSGIRSLHVEASESARRLFDAKGFTVDARQDFELRGVPIHNFAMSKAI